MLTPTGYRAIETLQVGELVLASDPETGVVKACRILQTFVREVAVVLEIQVGEEIITCTPEHPFWVPEQGWTVAGQLTVGAWDQQGLEAQEETMRIQDLSELGISLNFKPRKCKRYS